MNRFSIIALVALVTSLAAHAAEPVTAPVTPVQSTPAVSVAVPQKTGVTSQQDRMRDCNKQATGKKGAERKTFMKTCLSRKA